MRLESACLGLAGDRKGISLSRKKLGLIINPIAGMGGRVGLKGTDGARILKRAIELGARPEAPGRAMVALNVLAPIKDEFELLTYPDDMGENQARAAGIAPVLLGTQAEPSLLQSDSVEQTPEFSGAAPNSCRAGGLRTACHVRVRQEKDERGDSNAAGGMSREYAGYELDPAANAKSVTWPAHRTTARDTENAARDMLRAGVDLILFTGGDGTARNIYDAVGDKVPVLGVPAGVKIHSPVYATNPRSAGQLAAKFLKGEVAAVREAEVMDLDEDAFREGRVTARLYGYLRVPYEERLVQNLKSGSPESEAAALDGIAGRIIEEMEPGVAYIIGPGTTTRPIMEKLGLSATLLGIDVVLNGKLLVADASEKQLLQILDGVLATQCNKADRTETDTTPTMPSKGAKGAQIMVTIIGGQGYVFGRGNQQLSPEVIRKVGKNNIRIVATRDKLNALDRRPLLVDTGDDELNHMLSGYFRVLVSYDREVMYRIG